MTVLSIAELEARDAAEREVSLARSGLSRREANEQALAMWLAHGGDDLAAAVALVERRDAASGWDASVQPGLDAVRVSALMFELREVNVLGGWFAKRASGDVRGRLTSELSAPPAPCPSRPPLRAVERLPSQRRSKYDFPTWFARVAAGETVRLERGREFTAERETVSGLAWRAGAKAAGVRVELPREDAEVVLLVPASAPRAPRSKYDFPTWFARVAAGETVRLERGREFTAERETVRSLAWRAGAKAAGVRVCLPRDDEDAVLLVPNRVRRSQPGDAAATRRALLVLMREQPELPVAALAEALGKSTSYLRAMTGDLKRRRVVTGTGWPEDPWRVDETRVPQSARRGPV